MIDYLAIALTHGLFALAVWRLLTRPELDDEPVGTGEVPDEGEHGRALPRKHRPWLADRGDDAGSAAEARPDSGHG